MNHLKKILLVSFAFLLTFTNQLSAQGKHEDIGLIQDSNMYHLPMVEYSEEIIFEDLVITTPRVDTLDVEDGWTLYLNVSSSNDIDIDFNIKNNQVRWQNTGAGSPNAISYTGLVKNNDEFFKVLHANPGDGNGITFGQMTVDLTVSGSKKELVGPLFIVLKWELTTPNGTERAQTSYIRGEIDYDIFTVDFNTDGGSTPPEMQYVFLDDYVTRPKDPTKEGHSFMGWYKDLSDVLMWDFEKNKVTENLTLYAKWEKETYKVDLVYNNGDENGVISAIPYNTLIPKPDAPTKVGHSFEGWYRDSEFKNPWDFSSDTIKKDMTLYANYTINKYDVSFETNTTETLNPLIGVEYGTKLDTPKTLEKEGYNFIGWYTDSDLSESWDFEKDTVEDNLTLYAKWEKEIPEEIVIPDPDEKDNTESVKDQTPDTGIKETPIIYGIIVLASVLFISVLQRKNQIINK